LPPQFGFQAFGIGNRFRYSGPHLARLRWFARRGQNRRSDGSPFLDLQYFERNRRKRVYALVDLPAAIRANLVGPRLQPEHFSEIGRLIARTLVTTVSAFSHRVHPV
jgi:hypothetical protein